MSSELAARGTRTGPAGRWSATVAATGSALGSAASTLAARIERAARCGPFGGRSCVLALVSATLAALVGYATSRNAGASPQGAAVILRVALIVALVAAGLYAQTSRTQARMGSLLLGAGFVASLWLLNGSGNRILFSIGVMWSGVMPMLLAFLILAQPTGRLRSASERRFIWFTGGMAAVLWLLGAATSVEPPLRTPMLECPQGCPADLLSLGWSRHAGELLRVGTVTGWAALAVGTPLLVLRRRRMSSAAVRRSLTPVAVVAVAITSVLIAYLISASTKPQTRELLGGIYACLLLAIPLALLAGLARERMFMAQRLAAFVTQLARMPQADPEALMAAALRDPTLKVAYRRPGQDAYVDAAGRPVSGIPEDRAVAWIERGRGPVAAVMYNRELYDCERFVKAAGAVAVIRLEREQLEADLNASNADLAASRMRLLESVHAERRRLERDLHDGIQQHIVGLRIKLEMAAETIRKDPRDGERLVVSIGRQMDDVLEEMRSLARGIYPSLLADRGLGEALRSAARRSPVETEVHGGKLGRFAEEVEVAVYFCCMEALQNVAKHAHGDATAIVTLDERPGQLCFDVRDTGVGFDPSTVESSRGLVNMRDRIEAVGGLLQITSRPGHGSSVRGVVPVSGKAGPDRDVGMPTGHLPAPL